MLDVLALRDDFPQVPHLNLREQEYPRSLCVYEDPFPEYSMKWNPIRFIEDVRKWLARTARNELHQKDQPLEPLLEAGTYELVVPNGLLKGLKSGDHLFLDYDLVGMGSNRLVIKGRSQLPAQSEMFAVFLVGKVQTHGLIRRKPVTLADLQEFLKAGDLDVISACQQALREFINSGNRSGQQTRMVILVDLPKARHEGHAAERVDQFAFVTHTTISQLSSALGVSEVFQGKVVILIGNKLQADPKQLPIESFRRLETLSPETAAQFNGTTANSNPMFFVGLGALGSHVFINLIRAGFGRWTLLDRDVQLPHNAARHALPGQVGEHKATAMARMAMEIFPEIPIQGLIGDLLVSRDDQLSVASAIKNATAVVDCSASVAVGRKLARQYEGGRRVSAFLNPKGTDLVLLGEPEDRKIRLDQLEMMYYRELLHNEQLSGHLSRNEAPLRYANACRDQSVILPQDLIALHSGIASHAIKAFLAQAGAQITVWRTDNQYNVRRLDVPIATPIVYPTQEWTIVTDKTVIKRLGEWRVAKFPNETGGVLLGTFDMEQKIVYVTDGLPSPKDSKEWPTVYIRGVAGLRKNVNSAEAITQGGVEYVGEWHSHPPRHSANPSSDDLLALATLSGIMLQEARPAVMFIIGHDCELTILLEQKRYSAKSKRRS
jgi:hypothetical protein